ncbi:PIN-like domain-containing protein [Microcoleus sp. S36b_A4]|uniref:PIN-like domain-containing protein n=1 Tax=Microcoleus sp. S36b_A4 TaxID=3055420 RepID=UPI002FD6BBEB
MESAVDVIKDRLWIPHQVALEYHENRINRIKQAQSNFDQAKKTWNKTLSSNFNSKCFPPEIVKEMRENANKVFDTFWDKLAPGREELIQIDGTDYIRDKITDLFSGKIGESPVNQAELDEIYLEGEQRYTICRPPGFRDQNKDCYTHNGLIFQATYGDLILWKQILKHVKSNSLSHVIFITGDNKEDWWRIEGGKHTGRRELVEEILNAGAAMFYMYQPDAFLKCSRKYLQLDVKEEFIQQVQEVSLLNNLSEPELQDDSFQELSLAEKYVRNIESLGRAINIPSSNIERYVSNIESLGRITNIPLTNIERIVAAVNNSPSTADFAKKFPAVRAMQLAQDQYGLRNNTLVAGIIAHCDQLTALIENQNRLLRQAQPTSIIKQSIPSVNEEIESEDLTDSEASQEVESLED